MTKHVQKIRYREWDVCEKDFNRVKKAMNEIEVMLAPIPLTEEPTVVPTIVAEPVKEQNTASE
jgi:hypothetical protein